MRPARRFGVGGELAPPGHPAGAQWLYLEAVRRLVPEAMQALAVIALPADGAPTLPEAPLRAWCQQWGFTGTDPRHDWLLTVARRTAQWLREKEPTWPNAWVLVTSHHGPGSESIPAPHWEPDEETRDDFSARMNHYITEVERLAAQRGWTTMREKRTLDHFDWLARYQVGKWSLANIVDYYADEDGYPDMQVVSKALNETASLIGLKRRSHTSS